MAARVVGLHAAIPCPRRTAAANPASVLPNDPRAGQQQLAPIKLTLCIAAVPRTAASSSRRAAAVSGPKTLSTTAWRFQSGKTRRSMGALFSTTDAPLAQRQERPIE